ncbi:hypothetical protein [Curtobacterium aurantiacum]|uniref:hypothetical protein n=1 Tax=Curtobacterium aurantiacum TaxID=3236919 RepID=UPI001BE01638|nr:hypothetical protein [Curtobacterium flaccumfaciens]MBT1675106.1 hypothetical protein [Curtobacterium flaccumfaciens pv. flaccumfaciens]
MTSTTNLPMRRFPRVVDVLAGSTSESGAAAADAAVDPKERPLTMVAATRPAAPMDLRAVEALFL